MSQSVVPIRPPLLRAVDGIGRLLDDVTAFDPIYLTTGEKEELLVALERQATRLAALTARTLATAGDVTEAHGTRHAGAWLAHETRQDPEAGRRVQRFAEGLARRWPVLAEAYGAGSVTTAQAGVIGRALDDLPADLDPELRRRAEGHLVEQAAHFSPRDLKVLGRRVLEVLAPEVAETHEAKLLAREEQEAWDTSSITHRRLAPVPW